MKVYYPKLYNMAHLLALNVLLLPKDLTIIFICRIISLCHSGIVFLLQWSHPKDRLLYLDHGFRSKRFYASVQLLVNSFNGPF